MTWPTTIVPGDWLSVVADCVGIWGLITIVTTAKQVKAEVQRRTRLPEIGDSLEKLESAWTKLSKPGGDVHLRVLLVGRIEGSLNASKTYLDNISANLST
jgi:hypothetical protein